MVLMSVEITKLHHSMAHNDHGFKAVGCTFTELGLIPLNKYTKFDDVSY